MANRCHAACSISFICHPLPGGCPCHLQGLEPGVCPHSRRLDPQQVPSDGCLRACEPCAHRFLLGLSCAPPPGGRDLLHTVSTPEVDGPLRVPSIVGVSINGCLHQHLETGECREVQLVRHCPIEKKKSVIFPVRGGYDLCHGAPCGIATGGARVEDCGRSAESTVNLAIADRSEGPLFFMFLHFLH